MGEAVKDWSTNKVTITIDQKRTGQQERPYGPHVHDAMIAIWIPEGQMTGRIGYLDENYVKRIVGGLITRFCEGSGPDHNGGMDHYFSAHLMELKRTEFEEDRRAVWHVRLETPFTD